MYTMITFIYTNSNLTHCKQIISK